MAVGIPLGSMSGPGSDKRTHSGKRQGQDRTKTKTKTAGNTIEYGRIARAETEKEQSPAEHQLSALVLAEQSRAQSRAEQNRAVQSRAQQNISY